jgi:hypothetical protein
MFIDSDKIRGCCHGVKKKPDSLAKRVNKADLKYLSFGFTQQLHNTLPVESVNTMESTLDRGVLLKQRSLAEVELFHDPLEAVAPLPRLGISSSQYAESIQSEPPKEIAKTWLLPLRPFQQI